MLRMRIYVLSAKQPNCLAWNLKQIPSPTSTAARASSLATNSTKANPLISRVCLKRGRLVKERIIRSCSVGKQGGERNTTRT